MNIIDKIKQKFFPELEELRKENCKLKKKQQEFKREQNFIKNLLKDATRMDVDIHYKERSIVILSGTLKGRDYVNIFEVDTRGLLEVYKICKELEKISYLGRIDGHHLDCVIIDDMFRMND